MEKEPSNKTAKEKPKSSQLTKAKKDISIRWPRNEFKCKKGDEIDLSKLSDFIIGKLKSNNVI